MPEYIAPRSVIVLNRCEYCKADIYLTRGGEWLAQDALSGSCVSVKDRNPWTIFNAITTVVRKHSPEDRSVKAAV